MTAVLFTPEDMLEKGVEEGEEPPPPLPPPEELEDVDAEAILFMPDDFVPAAGPEAPEAAPLFCPAPVTRVSVPVLACLKAP
jgi:hypothetical protein